MALVIPPSVQQFTQALSRYATCWKLERTDGTIMRFTDHDKKLTVANEVYDPQGGFNSSARQKLNNLKVRNLEFVGFISDDSITYDDLKSGKYRDCKVTEMLVDWQYSWMGPISTAVYWIVEMQYDGEKWVGQVSGLTRWLTQRVGRVYSRICDHILGDEKCQVDLPSLEQTGTVTTVVKSRLVFTTTLSELDDFFKYGYITWTSGANTDEKAEIKMFRAAAGRIELALQTTDPIEAGDTFKVYPGCDRLRDTCLTKYSNVINFGGFPFIPGTDAALSTPDGKV